MTIWTTARLIFDLLWRFIILIRSTMKLDCRLWPELYWTMSTICVPTSFLVFNLDWALVWGFIITILFVFVFEDRVDDSSSCDIVFSNLSSNLIDCLWVRRRKAFATSTLIITMKLLELWHWSLLLWLLLGRWQQQFSTLLFYYVVFILLSITLAVKADIGWRYATGFVELATSSRVRVVPVRPLFRRCHSYIWYNIIKSASRNVIATTLLHTFILVTLLFLIMIDL